MKRRNRTFDRQAPLLALVALVGLVSLGLTGCVPLKSYVALGDSYSSGPVIPVQQNDPAGCLRSDHNYAHLVAPGLHLPAFRDASCSGAQTEDMTHVQHVTGPDPTPQFDKLDANTAAVSLTIGGNDIGFVSVIEACASVVNAGTPCQDKYVVKGDDKIKDAINATKPKIAAVLQGIHAKSPKAKIFLLSYLDILPDDGSNCFPQMPITDGDAPFLRDKEKELNAMLSTEANANGAVYVDTYTPSIGHDACRPLPTARWVEPVVPVNPAAPVHPNLAGMQHVAVILAQAMHQHGL